MRYFIKTVLSRKECMKKIRLEAFQIVWDLSGGAGKALGERVRGFLCNHQVVSSSLTAGF